VQVAEIQRRELWEADEREALALIQVKAAYTHTLAA
jgi:hypothetical protein